MDEIAEFFNYTSYMATKKVDVRTYTNDRYHEGDAADGADDVLDMGDDEELGLDDSEEESDKDPDANHKITLFDMVSDECK